MAELKVDSNQDQQSALLKQSTHNKSIAAQSPGKTTKDSKEGLPSEVMQKSLPERLVFVLQKHDSTLKRFSIPSGEKNASSHQEIEDLRDDLRQALKLAENAMFSTGYTPNPGGTSWLQLWDHKGTQVFLSNNFHEDKATGVGSVIETSVQVDNLHSLKTQTLEDKLQYIYRRHGEQFERFAIPEGQAGALSETEISTIKHDIKSALGFDLKTDIRFLAYRFGNQAFLKVTDENDAVVFHAKAAKAGKDYSHILLIENAIPDTQVDSQVDPEPSLPRPPVTANSPFDPAMDHRTLTRLFNSQDAESSRHEQLATDRSLRHIEAVFNQLAVLRAEHGSSGLLATRRDRVETAGLISFELSKENKDPTAENITAAFEGILSSTRDFRSLPFLHGRRIVIGANAELLREVTDTDGNPLPESEYRQMEQASQDTHRFAKSGLVEAIRAQVGTATEPRSESVKLFRPPPVVKPASLEVLDALYKNRDYLQRWKIEKDQPGYVASSDLDPLKQKLKTALSVQRVGSAMGIPKDSEISINWIKNKNSPAATFRISDKSTNTLLLQASVLVDQDGFSPIDISISAFPEENKRMAEYRSALTKTRDTLREHVRTAKPGPNGFGLLLIGHGDDRGTFYLTDGQVRNVAGNQFFTTTTTTKYTVAQLADDLAVRHKNFPQEGPILLIAGDCFGKNAKAALEKKLSGRAPLPMASSPGELHQFSYSALESPIGSEYLELLINSKNSGKNGESTIGDVIEELRTKGPQLPSNPTFSLPVEDPSKDQQRHRQVASKLPSRNPGTAIS